MAQGQSGFRFLFCAGLGVHYGVWQFFCVLYVECSELVLAGLGM